jgi:hypothetical protein
MTLGFDTAVLARALLYLGALLLFSNALALFE